MIKTDVKLIDELLERGVDEVIVKDQLRQKLLSGQKLRIKLGIDPTSPNLHLGRSIPLLKLRDLQQLGHQICLIVGDFNRRHWRHFRSGSERPMLSPKGIRQTWPSI
jgi:tyrosyl-tRNA synthetase